MFVPWWHLQLAVLRDQPQFSQSIMQISASRSLNFRRKKKFLELKWDSLFSCFQLLLLLIFLNTSHTLRRFIIYVSNLNGCWHQPHINLVNEENHLFFQLTALLTKMITTRTTTTTTYTVSTNIPCAGGRRKTFLSGRDNSRKSPSVNKSVWSKTINAELFFSMYVTNF